MPRLLPCLLLPCLLLLPAACATPSSAAPGGLSVASSLETRAEAAVQRQDWEEAGALGAQLTRQEPENARGWLLHGIALLGLERRAEAEQALGRSVALRDSPEARYNLGIVCAQQGRVEEALGHFERAVELRPDYGLGWKSVAKARAALGRFPEAAAALGEARRLRPEDPEVAALDFQLRQVLEAGAGASPDAGTP